MQLLKIKTIPFKYDLNIKNAKLTAPEIEPAKMSLKTKPLKIESKTEDIKIRMDSSEMRSSMGYKTNAELAREAPAKAQQATNSATAEYVNQGHSLAEPGMTVSQYVKQKILSDSVKRTNVTTIPSRPVDVSWEPASVETEVQESDVETNWESSAQKMQFIPSSITLEVKQLADVEIEYLGGFRYVPPSSAPDYKE